MNDKRDKDFVQHSIDTVLSSIQGDPWLAQKIMHQERTEPIVMKKKISTTLIAAIVLILATVTTLAATGAFQKLWEVWQNSFQKMNTTGEVEIVEEFDQEGFEKEYGGVKQDLVISTVPQEDDLDYDQAFHIARKAIIDAFGTPEAELDAMGVYPTFYHSPYEDEVNEWEFYITPRKGVNIDEDHDYDPPGEYRVTVTSPAGEVTMCIWYLDDFFPDYARRTWEAGKKDYVFEKAQNVQFYQQPLNDQQYFISLFEKEGFDLAKVKKSDEEKLARLELTLSFAQPEENLFYLDTPEVKAAINTMEEVYGLTREQMEKYCLIMLPSPLASSTEDYCFSFNYEIQFQKLEENRATEFENRILSYISRLGHHMICLDPDTLEAVKTVHANRTPAYEKADDPSALLGRRNWTSSDIPEFEALVNEAALIDSELQKEAITKNEAEKKFRQLMLAYGGDPAIYGTNP